MDGVGVDEADSFCVRNFTVDIVLVARSHSLCLIFIKI